MASAQRPTDIPFRCSLGLTINVSDSLFSGVGFHPLRISFRKCIQHGRDVKQITLKTS